MQTTNTVGREWPQKRNGHMCRVCPKTFMENTNDMESKCPHCGRTHEGILRQERTKDGIKWVLIKP
jgi:hypothetical protein